MTRWDWVMFRRFCVSFIPTYLVSSKLVSYLTHLPTLLHRRGVGLLTASSSPCLGSYHRLLDLRGVQCGSHERWLEMGGEVYPAYPCLGVWILEEEGKCGWWRGRWRWKSRVKWDDLMAFKWVLVALAQIYTDATLITVRT